MSIPLATIFYGDVTLETGSDESQFGYGDLTVKRNCYIKSTQDVVSGSFGALSVDGGIAVGLTGNFYRPGSIIPALTVPNGPSHLTITRIDTTLGKTSVSGGNAVEIQVGASSKMVSTDGNLLLSSNTKSLQLYGGLNSYNGVDIQATHTDGGVLLTSGVNGGINLGAGANGLTILASNGNMISTASNGNVVITSSNGYSTYQVNSFSNNQHYNILLNGGTDSQLKIDSSGNNDSHTALVLNTSSSNGNIQISNFNGLGNGKIENFSGSGGYFVTTNTGGPLTLTSQGAPSSFIVRNYNSTDDLTINLANETDSSVIIKSSGINSTKPAIKLETLHTNGNILLTQGDGSLGNIKIKTGSGGFITDASRGSITMTTYGASSLYTNQTTTDGQDLTVSVTGNTNSRVVIESSGTSSEAIKLATNNGSGGISLMSVGAIELKSSSSSLGIQIANTNSYPGIPVHIGTPSSITTVHGDLLVKGTTTTVDSEIVTIKDNIITVNNSPIQGSNGGVAIKRYQTVNDLGNGDVVSDSPEETGRVQSGTSTTIQFENSASSTANYYAGWWVKTYNEASPGIAQVRRIKSYDESTKTATIYDTSDELNNPSTPPEGLNFTSPPVFNDIYQLYPCHFVMTIWDESQDEFAFICSNNTTGNISHYSDLHINDLDANNININSINGSTADSILSVTLNHNTNPVAITADINKFRSGVYLLFVQPDTIDNPTQENAHAIFIIGRRGNISGPGGEVPGTIIRLMSVKGMEDEHLDMIWHSGVNSKPMLFYRPAPLSSGSSTFKIKVMTL
jgi:hypothetical protein